ncbi:hypothetical protein DPMN_055465 [Dreissena polymorpha]|uniref:Uncharacterized protein n=1 Tax=Dreissena polymorpha TaxID=45954 RepID=A0A9D4HU41_DREPO|nr:hypothetical protein DPMN_055465 [Dreissena polymorpha]
MSSNSKIQLLKEALYKKITSTEDVSALRQCLEKCERAALLSWVDENGYDMLHHTILANNVEAEGMLFALGLFKAPHEPKLHSYLHVAANLGNRSITAMLLQERPGDFSNKKDQIQMA